MFQKNAHLDSCTKTPISHAAMSSYTHVGLYFSVRLSAHTNPCPLPSPRQLLTAHFSPRVQLKEAEVTLTRVHYPDVKRGDFSQLTDADLDTFRGILDANRVITDEAELEMYNTDWWKSCRGGSRCCYWSLIMICWDQGSSCTPGTRLGRK